MTFNEWFVIGLSVIVVLTAFLVDVYLGVHCHNYPYTLWYCV